ncbi:hypothetical protein Tco_1297180 [Tanacetum coccineum]
MIHELNMDKNIIGKDTNEDVISSEKEDRVVGNLHDFFASDLHILLKGIGGLLTSLERESARVLCFPSMCSILILTLIPVTASANLIQPVIERLKHQGYIGEEPLKHWKKNGKLCKIDIINPDITIEDRYCCCHLLEILSCYSDQWLYFVDIPKQIWALHCMIAYRLCMALTASFAAESSMSWATDLHALDLSILIGVWLALSW